MSGSPIIQDEKLVGAVTHVLVNDPHGGTGFLSRICWTWQDKVMTGANAPVILCYICYNEFNIYELLIKES